MRTASWERKGRSVLLGIALPLWLAVVPGWTGFQEVPDAYQRRDYATALRAWLPAGAAGARHRAIQSGVLYEAGPRRVARRCTGVQWYRQAAAAGHATAQFNLGVLYGQGQGVPQDHLPSVSVVHPRRGRLARWDCHEQAVRNRHVAAHASRPPNSLQPKPWPDVAASIRSVLHLADAVAAAAGRG